MDPRGGVGGGAGGDCLLANPRAWKRRPRDGRLGGVGTHERSLAPLAELTVAGQTEPDWALVVATAAAAAAAMRVAVIFISRSAVRQKIG